MAEGRLRILVVEDDGFTRALVSGALGTAGHTVTAVDAVNRAMRALAEDDFHVVVTDLNLGGGPSGADLLHRVHEDQPWIGRVVLSSHASPELAVADAGALPPGTVYLVKSELDDVAALDTAVARALTAPADAAPAPSTDDSRLAVTRNQADVLRMLSSGHSTAVIARDRATTVRATERMVQRLYEKLGVGDGGDRDPRTAAVLLWQQGRVRVL